MVTMKVATTIFIFSAVPLPLSFGCTYYQHDETGGGGAPYACRYLVKTATLSLSVGLDLNSLQPLPLSHGLFIPRPLSMPLQWNLPKSPGNPREIHDN